VVGNVDPVLKLHPSVFPSTLLGVRLIPGFVGRVLDTRVVFSGPEAEYVLFETRPPDIAAIPKIRMARAATKPNFKTS